MSSVPSNKRPLETTDLQPEQRSSSPVPLQDADDSPNEAQCRVQKRPKPEPADTKEEIATKAMEDEEPTDVSSSDEESTDVSSSDVVLLDLNILDIRITQALKNPTVCATKSLGDCKPLVRLISEYAHPIASFKIKTVFETYAEWKADFDSDPSNESLVNVSYTERDIVTVSVVSSNTRGCYRTTFPSQGDVLHQRISLVGDSVWCCYDRRCQVLERNLKTRESTRHGEFAVGDVTSRLSQDGKSVYVIRQANRFDKVLSEMKLGCTSECRHKDPSPFCQRLLPRRFHSESKYLDFLVDESRDTVLMGDFDGNEVTQCFLGPAIDTDEKTNVDSFVGKVRIDLPPDPFYYVGITQRGDIVVCRAGLVSWEIAIHEPERFPEKPLAGGYRVNLHVHSLSMSRNCDAVWAYDGQDRFELLSLY